MHLFIQLYTCKLASAITIWFESRLRNPAVLMAVWTKPWILWFFHNISQQHLRKGVNNVWTLQQVQNGNLRLGNPIKTGKSTKILCPAGSTQSHQPSHKQQPPSKWGWDGSQFWAVHIYREKTEGFSGNRSSSWNSLINNVFFCH